MAGSGDSLADGRYEYARAAAADGDFGAAADVLTQALERAPDWAAGWFALGDACERLGRRAEAVVAFERVMALDAEDSQGAGARLTLLDGRPIAGLPNAYVRGLFDQYAPRFDEHLTQGLRYRGPALILAGLDRIAKGRRFATGLDLGCGAGLCGAALRPRVDTLRGVDLSPAMIEMARRSGLYDGLEVVEMEVCLAASPLAALDLIAAADALGYVGALEPVFAGAARALRRDGLFAATLELKPGTGFRLGAGLRFAHSAAYVADAAKASGLVALTSEEAWIRRENGVDVAGLTIVFAPR
jgi:predicted TPR repeat methyltransferase